MEGAAQPAGRLLHAGQVPRRVRSGPDLAGGLDGVHGLRLHDAVLGCLREAGFPIELTIQAYSVQDAYIYGFALQQSDMSSQTREDFAAIRTGRAHPSMFHKLTADYYGNPTPLQQLASFTVPEARVIIISPCTPHSISSGRHC